MYNACMFEHLVRHTQEASGETQFFSFESPLLHVALTLDTIRQFITFQRARTYVEGPARTR